MIEVLVIYEGDDIDIIMPDGGYAFSWFIQGVRKLACYSERITEPLECEDSLNYFLEMSRCYYANCPENVVTAAVAWLYTKPMTLHKEIAFNLTSKTSDQRCKIINNFLKLKEKTNL